MEKDYTIEKVGWFTNRKTIPPLTEEEKKLERERQTLFFENYVRFLQANGFTTRTILYPEDKANDDSEIRVSDLTNEGFDFFKYGIIRWRKKLDRAKDIDRAISDLKFIKKKLDEFNMSRNNKTI
ncbi:MAG: cyclopropane-fatty-acyl-phospholipid synthase [Phocaeicola vulgatus]